MVDNENLIEEVCAYIDEWERSLDETGCPSRGGFAAQEQKLGYDFLADGVRSLLRENRSFHETYRQIKFLHTTK